MSQPDFANSFTKIYRKTPYPRISPDRASLSANNKRVVITAAHTGIGYAIASNFAIAGAAHVIIIARRPDVLEQARTELAAAHPSTQFHAFAASIVDDEKIHAVFREIRRIAEPDVLVTSATYLADPANVLETPVQQAFLGLASIPKPDDLPSTTVHTDGNGAAPPGEGMTKEKVILDLSSAAAHVFLPQLGAYSASKLAFSRLLATAQDEASSPPSPSHPNLRTHSFHPGAILTRAARDYGHTEDTMPWDSAGLPGQFAVWLASPEAEFLKGRFVWANWDADELVERREQIVQGGLLRIRVVGRAEWGV
ncbi:hypothetical protein B0A49_07382 [Cryomyces minteri]|uniref:NAD(P)-binding protein n=1 Tax=Cryomyces minteri TaxID=331657 RepID=A0A4U0WMB8_9PEZI|nr:hypothetical protein B0A49_07382 [Cryomyces minteri]